MAASSHPAPTLLRVDEVADILGVDPRTVKRLATDGELPRVVLGRRSTRYRLADVESFIESRTQPPQTNTDSTEVGAVKHREEVSRLDPA